MPRGRRRSRGPDGLAGLPEEILQEILARLPARSVLRCRAVCRCWRRLTTDPAFLVAHHRHQPTFRFVSSYRTGSNSYYPDSLQAIHLQGAELRPVYRAKGFAPDASCDGLILTGGCIWNPITRQSVPLNLNPMVDRNFVGLYRHQPSGEYRVLFWRQSNLPSEVYCPNEFCVLTVGSKKPRRITCSLTPVEEELISGMGPTIRGAPVHLHGNLHVHWQKRWDVSYHRILVFDTVAESFRQMRPPAVNPRHAVLLFDMGGKLAASCSKVDFMEMRIFALQDYESEVWSFQYRIKPPEMEIRQFQQQGDWSAKVVSGEGDLLVSCFGWLLHYDRKGNLLAKRQYDDDLPVVMPHVLKESLIQHTFFQKEQNN